MNEEQKDEGIRGKKMLTGKRLVFAIVNSDMGKVATKIAIDTMPDTYENYTLFTNHPIKRW